MKVYFNSIGQFIEQDTSMDMFVKGNNGNVVECYFKDLDISDVNLRFRLLIKWSDGTTTNELPMNKSLKDEYVYLSLPTLKVEGETQFIIRIYDYDIIQHTAIFERVVLENIDASDDTISSEEYEVLLDNIESKQDVLISGSNIKTINGESIVGSGNIEIKAKDINLDNYVTQDEFQEKVVNETNYIVDCNHRHEITGVSNDEYKLAIGTQQMKINKVSGRTLVKNQIYKPIKSGDLWGGAIISYDSDNIITLSGVSTTSYVSSVNFNDLMNLAHTYMIELNVMANPNSIPLQYGFHNRVGSKTSIINGVGFTRNIYKQTQSQLQEGQGEGLAGFTANTDLTGIKYRVRIIDLTLAYGVGNEPTTIEEVLNDFPEYIPYDEGTFVHSNNKLVSTGRNLWKYGDVSGKTTNMLTLDTPLKTGTYTISSLVESSDLNDNKSLIYFYDKNQVGLGSVSLNRNVRDFKTINLTKDCYNIRFYGADSGSTSANDIFNFKNIQIEYGEVATDYEPYKEEIVEVGELTEFDYIDNVNNAKYINSGKVDLGEIDNWTYFSGYDGFYTLALENFFKENMTMPIEYNDIPYAIIPRYSAVSDETFTKSNNLTFTVNVNGLLKIRNKSCNGDINLLKQSLQGVKLLYKTKAPTIIEDVNLPIGMYVTEGGYQIQEGTIPYVVEKEYALNIVSQVKQNIQFDREQQEQINGLKNFLYQPLDYMQYYVEEAGNTELKLTQDMQINLYQINNSFDIYLEGHKCILTNPTDDEITIYGDVNLMGSATIYNYANIPQNRFTAVNQGSIAFDGLQSESIREILIEFVNNCWVIRRVFVGEV